MKKLIVVLSVILSLIAVMVISIPAYANNGDNGNKPVELEVTTPTLVLSEVVGNVFINVYGAGQVTTHIIKPNDGQENAWFRISSFSGYIAFTEPGISPGIPPNPAWFAVAIDSLVTIQLHILDGIPTMEITSTAPMFLPFAALFGLNPTVGYTYILLVDNVVVVAE